jgi:sporulation protein YlmC with PRC-barrel domain
MDLIRDVLDKQVVDRGQTYIGKVDSIVAELREGRPPRVVAIELGSIALMRRLGPRAERWMTRVSSRFGGVRHSKPHRIPWAKVRDIGVEIEFDIDVSQTAIFDWQVWLSERVIGRIPGA